jgi:hypothetical protein
VHRGYLPVSCRGPLLRRPGQISKNSDNTQCLWYPAYSRLRPSKRGAVDHRPWLRATEAQVPDLRLALDQEIAVAIDKTRVTLTDLAAAAGKSRQACYDALEREDLRHGRERATGR